MLRWVVTTCMTESFLNLGISGAAVDSGHAGSFVSTVASTFLVYSYYVLRARVPTRVLQRGDFDF